MQSFLIESLIRRKNGTICEMPPTVESPKGARYHFKPQGDDPRHIAAVADAAHAARFIQIPEGYALVADTQPPAVAATEGNGGGGSGGGASLTTPLAPAGDETPLEQLTDAQLREVFLAEVGRKAGNRAQPETMIAQIEAARQTKAAAALIAATP